jgi:hypothetical protein
MPATFGGVGTIRVVSSATKFATAFAALAAFATISSGADITASETAPGTDLAGTNGCSGAGCETASLSDAFGEDVALSRGLNKTIKIRLAKNPATTISAPRSNLIVIAE